MNFLGHEFDHKSFVVNPGVLMPHITQHIAHNTQHVTKNQIEKILGKLIGEQKQIPPIFSAKKVKGRKLYQLARQGKTIERWAEEIEIFDIKLLGFKWPILKIKVHSSSGTYIRALARDIGQALGCGALLDRLERTTIGEYTLTQASELSKLTPDNWQKNLFQ